MDKIIDGLYSGHGEGATINNGNNPLKRSMGAIKEYFVTTSASIGFYTPLMASMEYATGMEPDKVMFSRMEGAVSALILSYPYSRFRKWYEWC